MGFNSPQIQENSRKSQTYTNNIQAFKKKSKTLELKQSYNLSEKLILTAKLNPIILGHPAV